MTSFMSLLYANFMHSCLSEKEKYTRVVSTIGTLLFRFAEVYAKIIWHALCVKCVSQSYDSTFNREFSIQA